MVHEGFAVIEEVDHFLGNIEEVVIFDVGHEVLFIIILESGTQDVEGNVLLLDGILCNLIVPSQ